MEMPESAQPNLPETTLEPAFADALTAVREALGGLQYGQIVLTIHNGLVTQLERIERKRLQVGRKDSK
jgi:hypothetical protein